MRLLLHAGGDISSAMGDTAALLGDAGTAVFVPYAVRDIDGYTRRVADRFAAIGVKLVGVHTHPDPVAAVAEARGIVVGGGNSFRLVRDLHELGLLDAIRDAVASGTPYWGASAGANVACPTIRTTNDMPIVQPVSLDAADLVPFQINPHYLDSPRDGLRVGETREERIREFLEANDVPVVALREGSWLVVEGAAVTMRGSGGGVLFTRSAPPLALGAGAALGHLLRDRGRFDRGGRPLG